jgi:hypothetical protein
VTAEDVAAVHERRLAVPVAGVRAASIPSTFLDARSGGRVHQATDILAPRGTPVVAADDGRIWKLRQGGIGGITIYALDPSERIVYYYAHLDAYRDGLVEGQPVSRGDTLGFVGTTGNSPKHIPHLHFQVAIVPADRRYWAGLPVDPVPFLREAERARLGGDAVLAAGGPGTRGVARPAAGTAAARAALRPTVPLDAVDPAVLAAERRAEEARDRAAELEAGDPVRRVQEGGREGTREAGQEGEGDAPRERNAGAGAGRARAVVPPGRLR